MRRELSIFTQLHKRTRRDYVARMTDDKVRCMQTAKAYEYDYWDGNRRYGYGGYTYDGRWKVVAEEFIEQYNLGADSRILDVGCGKAYLLFELKQLLPASQVCGIDISRHALADAPESIRSHLRRHDVRDPLPFEADSFDLVISLGCLHNLRVFELARSLEEIERVGEEKYIMTESYRNDQELFNLQCWALTAESFFDHDEWIWIFDHFGYSGDYEFIYFE